MKIRIAPCVLLVAILLAVSPVAAAPSARTSQPLPYEMILLSDYYEPFQIDAPATPTTVSISMSANTSLTVAFMTSQQFYYFNDLGETIGNALYIQNSSFVQHSIKVNEGLYYLVFFSYGFSANVSYNIQTFPVSPYLAYPLPSPEPTGISAYGLYNNSGVVTPYTVESSDVVGVADINSLQAYNATAPALNDTVSGATLQLNSVLVVNEKGGTQQNYWVQNTPDFVTAASKVAWADNIWNASVSGFLSNSTITSTDGGYAYSFSSYGSTGYYYSFESSNSTYRLPLQIALLVSESVVPGVGVEVQAGVQMLGNGTASAHAIDWFDEATIHDPSAQSAYFFVSGNSTAPDGLFYETEFVFGGEGNGEATLFTQMSASLGLFYGNSTSGVQTSYPSLYTFGDNTGETADNLRVTYLSDGFSSVSSGTPNYVYMGSTSGTFTLPSAGGTISIPTASTSSTSSQTSTTSLGLTMTTLIVIGALIAVILVLAALLVLRGRGGKAPVVEVPAAVQPVSRYCMNCGTALEPGASFCPNCGAQQRPYGDTGNSTS